MAWMCSMTSTHTSGSSMPGHREDGAAGGGIFNGDVNGGSPKGTPGEGEGWLHQARVPGQIPSGGACPLPWRRITSAHVAQGVTSAPDMVLPSLIRLPPGEKAV